MVMTPDAAGRDNRLAIQVRLGIAWLALQSHHLDCRCTAKIVCVTKIVGHRSPRHQIVDAGFSRMWSGVTMWGSRTACDHHIKIAS